MLSSICFLISSGDCGDGPPPPGGISSTAPPHPAEKQRHRTANPTKDDFISSIPFRLCQKNQLTRHEQLNASLSKPPLMASLLNTMLLFLIRAMGQDGKARYRSITFNVQTTIVQVRFANRLILEPDSDYGRIQPSTSGCPDP